MICDLQRCRERFVSNRDAVIQRHRHRSDCGFDELGSEAVGVAGQQVTDLSELMLNEWRVFQQDMEKSWDGSPETSWVRLINCS